MDFKKGDKVVFFPSTTAKRVLGGKDKIPAIIAEQSTRPRKRIKIEFINTDFSPRYVDLASLDPWTMYPELFE